MQFEKKYSVYLEKFNSSLACFTENLDCKPDILRKSMLYSLNVGGKRVRPVLAYAAAELFGLDDDCVKNFALAIELIHTYSLIHDDLPEMDNDDFRRGQPSNHKVFGAGNAVLAGDALLNTAHTILIRECRRGDRFIDAAQYISESAGIKGMICGQSADLLHEGDENCDEETLYFICRNKTARLIAAPLVIASILSGGRYYSQIKNFGEQLGILFQIIDDILDVEGDFSSLGKSIGKDKKEKKYTSVTLYGLEASKVLADEVVTACTSILDGIDGDCSFLRDFVAFVRARSA